MKNKKTGKSLGSLLTILILLAAIAWALNRNGSAKPPPSAPGYYTGPLRSKNNPNLAATEDGTKVDLPPLSPPKPRTNEIPAGENEKSSGEGKQKEAP